MSSLPAVQAVLRDTVAVDWDEELIDRCVDLRVAGMVRGDAIARRLNAGTMDPAEQVAPEAVQACLQSAAFARTWDMARQDPEGWKQRRLRNHRMFHRSMNKLDERVEDDSDKRTQMSAIGLRLGLGGHTPQTQVQVGPDQNFMDFITKMMTKRDTQNAPG
jgi:hypothetical protein